MMIIEETIQKMLELKMHGMAKATRELLDAAPSQQLPFEDKLGIIVDREWSERDNRRVSRRIKEARLTTQASLDAVDCDAARGLEKTVIKQLMTCQWAKSKQNVLVTGATGTGKSFLGAALAESACRHGMRALFVRVPRLVEDLAVARASGSYSSALVLSCMDLRMLDETTESLRKEKLSDEYDHVILAGAALGATTPLRPHWGQTFWDHLDLAVSLHEIKKLIIVEHEDCGAYAALLLPAGNRKYIGDRAHRKEEEGFHHAIASELAKQVKERYGLDARLLYAELESPESTRAKVRAFDVP